MFNMTKKKLITVFKRKKLRNEEIQDKQGAEDKKTWTNHSKDAVKTLS